MKPVVKHFNPIFKHTTTEQLTESLKVNARRVGCTRVTIVVLEELVLRYYDKDQDYKTHKRIFKV